MSDWNIPQKYLDQSKEIERLEAELDAFKEAVPQKEIERLREALKKYGQHLPECTKEPLFCDCGLLKAKN